jgi:chromosome partitioning protein
MANFKGGVAKSTTSVNVAATLAQRGHRTLLVDCDPQANSSEMFLDEDAIEMDLRSIIVEKEETEKVIQQTRIGNLDVLPASFDLAFLDKELVVSPNGVQRIDRALRPVRELYDYIVIDTGPNLSHLTLGALAASQHVVIPVSATVWASKGLLKFVRWIDGNRDEEVLAAELLGLVATIVQPSTRIGRALLEDLPQSGMPSFRTFIPRRIKAEDAVMDRLVVGEPGVDISLTTAYQDLTTELVERIAKAKGPRHAR